VKKLGTLRQTKQGPGSTNAIVSFHEATGFQWEIIEDTTRPRLVPAEFGVLHSVMSNQRTIVFRLYLVKIVQTLTN
jgi:hypothetical protein